MTAPLDGIVVLDLATTRAELAGRLLGELGAEVIKIEPPGGCESRSLPPFEHGREGDPEASLYWAAAGLGKKSVVIDYTTPGGQDEVRRLAASADVVIESFDPGVMDQFGLGYAALAAINPALVYVSVTPFGQDGPEAGRPANDLTLEAAGGLLGLQGDGDRPPIPVGYPQASFHSGTQAAADATIALFERARSGLGQHLDVSMQAVMVWTLMNATGYPPNTGGNPPGFCEQRALPSAPVIPGLNLPPLFTCADGFLSIATTLPVVGGRTHHELMRWAEEKGMAPAELAGRDWRNWIGDLVAGTLAVADVNASIVAIQAFLNTMPKAEIQAHAARTGTLVGAIYTVADLLGDEHLAAREYWTTVGGRIHPGPFAKMSATPVRMDRPAPRLGADQAILLEPRIPRPRPDPDAQRRPAYDGLKVADFAWVGVGPIISKSLADHGATVVHVESSTRPDILRLLPPFKDGQPGINRAQFMANFNSSKLGLGCDLSTPEGRELANRLIDWADVVVESFTPGTMARLGLDYETIRKRKPAIIMLSSCLRGQTGPEAGYTGFGGQGAALAGLFSVTGWPDRPPVGPWGAYTDFLNPRYGGAALTAALIHREATGEGQYIDLAQTEAGIRFMEPLILDFTVNGRVAGPAGHDSIYAAPHGVFATAGVERYIAIATASAAEWRALRSLAPLDAFAGPEYDGLEGRIAQRGAIDAALAGWCADQDGFALGQLLGEAGVPAYPVLYPTDLYEDAQLNHRGFFVTLDHGEMGPTPYDGLATVFSATPGHLRNAAPMLGQDTEYVLSEILHVSEADVIRYASAGALS